eukprot:15430312-Alexandrium_andersonii.AAC.1
MRAQRRARAQEHTRVHRSTQAQAEAHAEVHMRAQKHTRVHARYMAPRTSWPRRGAADHTTNQRHGARSNQALSLRLGPGSWAPLSLKLSPGCCPSHGVGARAGRAVCLQAGSNVRKRVT